jgi:alkylation response protein AidB-like acyl-CoA dehydrogenase
VQIRLAEMAIKVEAARLLIHRAASERPGRACHRMAEASIAKCFANEIAREVTGHGDAADGRLRLLQGVPDGARMRDAWGWGIAGGAIDIQKVNIAGAMVGRRFDQRR